MRWLGQGPPNVFRTALPGSAFSPQEQEYYQQLFSQVDRSGTGRLDGLTAASFLTKSGVAQDILRRIWEIADAHSEGVLTRDRFFVACRLVAHAQAGHAPAPELAAHEPAMLPEFQGIQRQRQPSETSSVPGSPAPSARGGASEFSELQPVIAADEDQVRRAVQAMRQATRSASPRTLTHSRWAPSQRERRKYATLFKRTDWDGDGFVQGHEARDLLERSRLDHTFLGTAWDHADQDRDGKLNFREFVCLVHLVTCVVRGAPMPLLHEGLPYELTAALDALESPEVLVAEREASRSRSTSPMPSGLFSPFATPRRDSATLGANLRSEFDFRLDKAGQSNPSPDTGSFGAHTTLEDVPAMFGTLEPGGEKKKKKEKKNKRDESFDSFDPLAASAEAHPESDAPAPWPGEAASEGPPDGSPDTFRPSLHEKMLSERVQSQLRNLAGHFDSIMAADREVSRQLRREVDELQDELRHMREVRGQLQQRLHEERSAAGSVADQCAQLEASVSDARRRLADLREERRAVNLEGLSLRRDRLHCSEELQFMQDMMTDEEQMLETVYHANNFLDKSQNDLELHTEVLERQRRNLLQQVSKEKELVRHEERQNAELRNRLEQLRRQQAAQAVERREAILREQKIREMQEHGRLASRPLSLPSTHTWAQTIAAQTLTAGGRDADGGMATPPYPRAQAA